MASFDIRGDVLSDKQIKYVCDVLEKHGFNANKVFIETLGKAGDNYSANVKEIIVENDNGVVFRMIAKVAPTSEHRRKSLTIETTFANEVSIYDEVLPTFRQLEIDADVPEEDRFIYPVCYGTYMEQGHEIILLEDLRKRNFFMLDRFKGLKNEEVKLIIKMFAQLHSFSFLLRIKQPVEYKRLTDKLYDPYASEVTRGVIEYSTHIMVENIVGLLDSERNKNIIRNLIPQFLDELHKIKECDRYSEYSVITHGDAWINNILFNRENDIIQDCVLIDYQLCFERSPACDLHYLINSSTDYATRSKYYNEWMVLYHEELKKQLAQFGLQDNDVYPKDKMNVDLKRYAKFSFVAAVFMANIVSLDQGDAARLKDNMNTLELKEVADLFKPEDLKSSSLVGMKKIIEGLIDSFYELGYFE